MNDDTFVDQCHISNAKTTFLSRFANVIPRAISYGIGVMLLLNTCPPKSFDDSINFLNKRFGEEDSGHKINTDRRKHKLNILQPTSMVDPIGF
jgi:hypothetical protein